ncbi:hypothetical protein B1H10_02100 [candidate division KSB1 bacterium 4484_188]|nr:MAG: hypothetical protein B1H10_02100 [candidate division KSB1 bacterium 4484_188]HFE62790.1 tetratricopeptide repeat protein [Caldithrix sp.]
MSRKCSECGGAVPDNANFCPKCGASVRAENEPAEKGDAPQLVASMNKFNLIYLVALIAIVITAIYSYRYFIPVSQTKSSVKAEQIPAEQPPVLNQKRLNELQGRLKKNPHGITENVAMGNFYFDNSRFDEALLYYQDALKHDPNNADVIVDAGVCFFNLTNLDKAKEYFNKALQLNPNHPNALYNLGVIYAQSGDMEAMLNEWNKLIEVAPESGPAKTARQMIEQVKKNTPGK